MKSVHEKLGDEWLVGLNKLGGEFIMPDAKVKKENRYEPKFKLTPKYEITPEGYYRDSHGSLRKVKNE